jgi:hypothetical protein
MAKLSPIGNNAQFINGIPASGAKLFFYAAGSSTKQTTYADEAGLIPQTNPIILDSRGEPSQPIWLTEGLEYKVVFTASTDTDPPTSPIWDVDNVTGVNDSSVATRSQWVDSGVTPTYVNATQFTLPGDQTTEFHVNRRIKATVTAGTVYGYITSSIFGALTTLDVVLDSGALDSGLSNVQLGILTYINPSIPKLQTSQYEDGSVTNAKLAFDGGAFEFRNRLINPRGEVYQIAVAATADDTYFADQWYALTQTGTVLPSVLSDVADGYPVGVRLTQSQAIAQRFGYAQIIEAKNCKDLRGQSGTLVPRIRVSNSQAIRYAILGWTGTADTVTSDVVLDWTSASYTAGGFFLAANLSVLAVGSMTPAANTLTSLTELTASLGSAFNNIIIMVWTEGTAAQNFTLDFVYNQFEQGESATPFEFRDIDRETFLCERYFEKTFSASVAPASNAGLEGAISTTSGAALSNTTTTNYVFKTEKRAIPTIVTYNPSAAGSDWRGLNDATNIAATAENIGTKQASIAISGTPTAGRKYAIHATASARL